MSLLDRVVGRCRVPMSSPLTPDECNRRLTLLPDFITSEAGINKLALEKNTGSPYFRLRRAPPPVVHATLTPMERGTDIVVEGRMNYSQLGTLVAFTLFFCVPVTLIVVASVRDGRPLNNLGSVIGFLAVFLATIWVVSVLGTTGSVRGVAQRVAQVLEATWSSA